MKRPDKFLTAIVIGTLLLVAFILLLPKPGYQSEDSPEGVVRNYLLALQNEDYERAYGYLSPTLVGYPEDVVAFQRNVERLSPHYRRTAPALLRIGSGQIIANQASVYVTARRFNQVGLFNEVDFLDNPRLNFDFEVKLTLLKGDWKLIDAHSDYFAFCWNREDGCP